MGRMRLLAGVVIVWALAYFVRTAISQETVDQVDLTHDWRLQSLGAGQGGAALSKPNVDVSTWHKTSVPSTVLAALVREGVYKDIFVGRNLESIRTKPFETPWWYRKEFDLTDAQAKANGTLNFDGINYRANIYLNGKQLASEDKTWGAYRRFHLDVSGQLVTGKNVLAVEVLPPKKGDFTVGFVDWNPVAPDHEMGLFRPVSLHLYKTVAVTNVFVESAIDHATWENADLTIRADLTNNSGNATDTDLNIAFDNMNIQQHVTLQPHETRQVKFTPADHPELHVLHAKLWWPWELGTPNLHALTASVLIGEGVADATSLRFGIRETKDYLNEKGYRGYIINGKKLLIRGGGWVDDLLLREDPAKLDAQFQYVRALNLNTIRLEGMWGSSQALYDLADQNGILIMMGWSCQWEWQEYLGKPVDEIYGGFLSAPEQDQARSYLNDQVLWLRNHPSIFVWVLGSDKLPKPELEKSYGELLADIDPTRPTLMSCHANTSTISGPVNVKMEGPYEYVTPNYWYEDTTHGGAYGFNTETGPGPQPPPFDSLKRMLPESKLWPINDVWEYHCGLNEFKSLKTYLNAFTHRYGEARTAEEFAFKSQAANYEAIRPMYEAFAINRPNTTGIIQWMLNGAWPKMYWQLYDYYLNPGGSFFGAKKGAAPLGIMYNYKDHQVYVANQFATPVKDAQATVTIYDLHSKKVFEKTERVNVDAFGSASIEDLSSLKSPTPVYFVDMHLRDSAGNETANNFYWLCTKPDVLSDKSDWFVTYNSSFTDFTSLQHLPPPQVTATYTRNGTDADLTLTNPGNSLAFFIECRLSDPATGHTLLPVIWSDNYISIPPGSSKTLHAHLLGSNGDGPATLNIQGWNITAQALTGNTPQ